MKKDQAYNSEVEIPGWTETFPQVLASIVISSLHLVVGQTIAYSGVIVPQMIDEHNRTESDAIPITESDSAWIASAPVFSGLAASIICGVSIDYIGRLKTTIIGAVPGIIGLVLIATASNMIMIIVGRIIMGFTFVFISNPCPVYVSEISRPDVRGSFLTFMQVFMSMGMVLIYLEGWKLHWRTMAWLTNAYLIIPAIFVCFIPESPSWLVSKGRIVQARKSLNWLYKYSKNRDQLVEDKLTEIQEDQQQKEMDEKYNWKDQLKMFLLPTFYKPFLVMSSIFFFQQFSGTFVIIFNCVIFFREIGTEINPYFAAICISGMKVVMACVTTVLMKNFNRRTLLLISASGMTVCMTLSGLNTRWIQQGESTHTWIPLCLLLLYVIFSSAGLTSMPFIIAGELFPLKIRGMAYGLCVTIVNLFSFAALQCYFPLYHLLGGSSGQQFFFAIMSLAVMIVIYMFLPETHRYKLIDIENHFWNHTLYTSPKKHKKVELLLSKTENYKI